MPAKIAAGRKDMLATTWSKPMATNAMTGKNIARTLPLIASEAIAIQTARHTSQLAPRARRKTCHDVSCSALVSAMPTSRSYVIAAVVPSSAPELPITPVRIARKYATNSAPTTLPSSTSPRLRSTSGRGCGPRAR